MASCPLLFPIVVIIEAKCILLRSESEISSESSSTRESRVPDQIIPYCLSLLVSDGSGFRGFLLFGACVFGGDARWGCGGSSCSSVTLISFSLSRRRASTLTPEAESSRRTSCRDIFDVGFPFGMILNDRQSKCGNSWPNTQYERCCSCAAYVLSQKEHKLRDADSASHLLKPLREMCLCDSIFRRASLLQRRIDPSG